MIHRNSFSKFFRNFVVLTLIVIFIIPGCGGGGGGNGGSTTPTSTPLAIIATQQPDGSLYYTGTYNGTQVRFSHQGTVGQGQWYLYSGTPTNRIRTTVSDTGGVQEILAMDTGLRTTINYVGTERVEYRFYASNGKFAYGAVLYAVGNLWKEGLMFSEAFPGYNNLVHVTDVTTQITSGKTTLASVGPSRNGFEFISTAYAAGFGLTDVTGLLWDKAKILGWNGLVMVTGIVESTLYAAGGNSLVATAGGALVEGVATALVTPVLGPAIIGVGVGLAIWSLVHSNPSNASDIIPIAYGIPSQPTPPTVQIVDTTPTATTTADYTAVTNPTTYTTTPPPVVPTPLPPAPACVAPNVLLNGVCTTVTPVASLTISPTAPSVLQGATVQLSASASDSAGSPLSPPNLQWTSSNTSVATVDSAGLVTAASVGTSTITVTEPASGVTTSTSVTVPGLILNITPTNPSVLPGATAQFTGAATDALGTAVGLPANLTWISSNPAVATVDQAGLLTAIALGSTTITVTDPVSHATQSSIVSVKFEITPLNPYVGIGQTIQLKTTTINPAPVVFWTSSNSSVATVDTTGLVTGVNLGTVTISANDPFSSITATTQLVVSDYFVRILSASCVSAGIIPTPQNPPNLGGLAFLYSHFISSGIAAGPVGTEIYFQTSPTSNGLGSSTPTITTCGSWTGVYTWLGAASFCSRAANDPPTTTFSGSIYMMTYPFTGVHISTIVDHVFATSINGIPFGYENIPVTCPL